MTSTHVADEDRMIDSNFILNTGLYRSRTSLYAAEAAGEIPVSMKIGSARRWRLKTWRAHFAQVEADAIAAATRGSSADTALARSLSST